MPLTYGSLFSGAGGFDLGFDRAGLECRFQCEIDPQASAVLARHWPDVPKHTDIRTVRQKDVGAVDVIVGGFPCQDLSVAGKRRGLQGERSGLYYELLRLVGLCRPRLVVWENVPGLLSSDDGRDFGRVLRGLADCGYFGAWRVLDARFFGVPQRRRRVFGVFARGRAGAVRCGEILALTAGVRGDSPQGREAGEDVAFTLTSSVGRNSGGTRVGNAWNTNYVAARCQTSSGYRSDGETDNFVCVTGDKTHALTAEGHDASEDGTGRGTPVIFQQNQRDEVREMKEAGALAANAGMKQQNYVFSNRGNDTGDATETLRATSHGALPPSATPHAVRRLTPRECERLMSWPDDWTRWDDKGNEFADGPRYRMAGNGVVSNVAKWIARRINQHTGG